MWRRARRAADRSAAPAVVEDDRRLLIVLSCGSPSGYTGHRDPNHRVPLIVRLHLHGTPVAVDNLLRDVEAQAKAFASAGIALTSAKCLEYMRERIGGDATSVGD